MNESDPPETDAGVGPDAQRTSVVWVATDTGEVAAFEDAGVEVTAVEDGKGALEAVDADTDCIVMDVPVPGLSWEAFTTRVPAETSIVLYTDRDPTAVSEEVLRGADSLVQRGGPDHRDFLLTKVKSVTTDAEAAQRRTDVGRLAAERVDGLAWFLVTDDGSVVSASEDFETVFPEADVAAGEDFYERLATVLADEPAALGELLALPGSDSRREGEILPITLSTGGRRDVVHCSYPLPVAADAARLELFEDVTVGQERAERLELFETLVMGAQDGLYTLDANGDFDFCNPAMADQLGYDREKLLGMHASEVMAEGELERGQQRVQELVADPDKESTVYDMTFVTKDGDHRDVSLHVQLLPSPDDSYAGLVGVMRDVTERKERKRELERFETIIQALGDPVYAVDETGEIIYVNEAFEEQTGYDAARLVGEEGSLVLSEESYERMEEVVLGLVENPGETETLEVEVVTKEGHRFPAEVHTALLPPHDGTYHGNAGVVRDITERKRREERLEEFTSVVAHDLRGPLGVGKGNLDLYRQTGDEQRLDKVEGAFEEMEQLIDDLLELARHGEIIGTTERVDLEATARDAWEQQQTEEATLVCESLGTVRADRDRLRQALENLFGNSVEHGGPTVTVTVESIPGGFAVEDDGPGIPKDQQDSVFTRGFTTSDEGTGFGLAIVGEIVGAHGWDIEATDGDSGGARFEITGVDSVE